jgi:tRNA(Ser,Leu) C12 N-acetylase TAN1
LQEEAIQMDWNVVISIYQDGFPRARRALAKLGDVRPSGYYNVLTMSSDDDPLQLVSAVEQLTEEKPALYDAIARVAPAMHAFEFHSAEEFRERTKSIVLGWAPRLGGKAFHVRLHLRGAGPDLHSTDLEKFLDDAVVEATAMAGTRARISFTSPDAVIAIDTIDDRGGASIWTSEELAKHRLLRPD